MIPPPDPSKHTKSKAHNDTSSPAASGVPGVPSHNSDPVRAILILKTFDPASGATLKYKTTKAAEVSRLIQILGRLARPMAGLPKVAEDVPPDLGPSGNEELGSGVVTPVGDGKGTVAKTIASGPKEHPSAGAQSGSKKKKKGKK